MKHLFTLFLLFCFGIQNISAQNFQMLKSNSEYIYKGSSEKLRSIRVDSVAFDGDSIFYMNNHIRPIENENFECFTLHGASMIGKQVHIKADGTHVLFNAINDTIIIKTQNNIGEPWICWKHPENGTQIIAEVQLQVEESFLGTSDIVKHVYFQMLDADSLPNNHEVNSLPLSISENHGMINVINFYVFPALSGFEYSIYYPQGVNSFPIAGMSNPELGIQNLTAMEIFDYEVGDELHVLEYYVNYGIGTEKHIIQKVFDKTILTDSIIYEFENTTAFFNVQLQDLIFYNQEVEQKFVTIKADDQFDPLPDEHVFYGDNTYYLNEFRIENDLRVKTPYFKGIWFSIDAFEPNLGCISQGVNGICFSGENKRYIEGLGGPYYTCQVGAPTRYGRLLNYYKKGEVAFGEPFILNVNHISSSPIVKLYPNPVVESFFVETELINLPAIIEVRDLQGRLVLSEIIQNEKSHFRFNNQSKGMFIYTIQNQKGLLQTGKFIGG